MIRLLPYGRAYCDCGCEHCLMNPARFGVDPYTRFDETAIALQSLDRYLTEGRQPKKKSLTIDFNDPENMGGQWLQPLRDAAEKLRRAGVKAARKAKPKKK